MNSDAPASERPTTCPTCGSDRRNGYRGKCNGHVGPADTWHDAAPQKRDETTEALVFAVRSAAERRSIASARFATTTRREFNDAIDKLAARLAAETRRADEAEHQLEHAGHRHRDPRECEEIEAERDSLRRELADLREAAAKVMRG